MMPEEKEQQNKKALSVAKRYVGKHQLRSDPNGSYTGKTKCTDETPVQDADDL